MLGTAVVLDSLLGGHGEELLENKSMIVTGREGESAEIGSLDDFGLELGKKVKVSLGIIGVGETVDGRR